MTPRRIRPVLALAAVALLAAAFAAPNAGALSLKRAVAVDSAWAPASSATVHPGVQVFTEGAQCTSNFVFQEGERVFLGQAAHCSGTGGQTETDGCTSGSLPLGTPVEVTGADNPGTLAYNSWLAMQAAGESDPDACAFNDFALIQIDAADIGKVNPSIPAFGGPTGVGAAGEAGSNVYSYGNSELRLGVTTLSPKQGLVLQNEGNGWSHIVLTLTPGVPGDSGSGFYNESGEAIGVLSTLQIAPLAGTNGVGDLAKELAYARSHGFPGLQLVPGTEPFKPNLLEAILGA
ncbi:MAG TPA: serine protease [Solirubrobacterales bacterium]